MMVEEKETKKREFNALCALTCLSSGPAVCDSNTPAGCASRKYCPRHAAVQTQTGAR